MVPVGRVTTLFNSESNKTHKYETQITINTHKTMLDIVNGEACVWAGEAIAPK